MIILLFFLFPTITFHNPRSSRVSFEVFEVTALCTFAIDCTLSVSKPFIATGIGLLSCKRGIDRGKYLIIEEPKTYEG